jgi:hypothetical protein
MSEHAARCPHGVVIITPEFGCQIEADTLSCVHCGGHWIVQPGSGRQRSWCMNCAGPTCGAEHCVKHCIPTEEMLQRIERRWERMHRSWE